MTTATEKTLASLMSVVGLLRGLRSPRVDLGTGLTPEQVREMAAALGVQVEVSEHETVAGVYEMTSARAVVDGVELYAWAARHVDRDADAREARQLLGLEPHTNNPAA